MPLFVKFPNKVNFLEVSDKIPLPIVRLLLTIKLLFAVNETIGEIFRLKKLETVLPVIFCVAPLKVVKLVP